MTVDDFLTKRSVKFWIQLSQIAFPDTQAKRFGSIKFSTCELWLLKQAQGRQAFPTFNQ